jgi:hypothetical protein
VPFGVVPVAVTLIGWFWPKASDRPEDGQAAESSPAPTPHEARA